MIINDGEVKKADIAKIHSEINQILNQRYNFIAIAITIFGFFIASFNFKEKLHISIPYLDNGCIITIVFLFILSTINYFISILTRQFYILRNYLIVNNFSFWERDYSKFIEKHLSVSYTKSLRILLLLLGILMLFISFCDKYSDTTFKLDAKSDYLGPIIYLIISILYYATLYSVSDKLAKNVSEDTIKTYWKEIESDHPA